MNHFIQGRKPTYNLSKQPQIHSALINLISMQQIKDKINKIENWKDFENLIQNWIKVYD